MVKRFPAFTPEFLMAIDFDRNQGPRQSVYVKVVADGGMVRSSSHVSSLGLKTEEFMSSPVASPWGRTEGD